MYTKSLLKTGGLLIAVAMLSFAACKHNDTNNTTTTPALTNADDNGGYASDGARLEQTNDDVISITDAAAASGGSNLRTTATTSIGCATVTNDTTVTPHVLTINFGSTYCTCIDLRERKGEIIVTYTGHYKDSGSTHTITYNNYFLDGMQVTGSKTVTNEGTNSSGQVWYNVTVNDSLILGSDSVISWTGNRTRTWLAGYLTPDRSDDVYAIGGTTVLTRANGHVFTFVISASNPLTVALACTWIESGIVTVSSSTFVDGNRTLDYSYGGGGCDDMAQLTIGTHTYVITLH